MIIDYCEKQFDFPEDNFFCFIFYQSMYINPLHLNLKSYITFLDQHYQNLVKFIFIDLSYYSELINRFEITTSPTIFFYRRDKKKILRKIILTTKFQQIEKHINKWLYSSSKDTNNENDEKIGRNLE